MVSDGELTALVDDSALATYGWHDNDPAPRAYLHGMILAFARAHAMLVANGTGSGPPDDDAFDDAAWRTGCRAAARAATATIGDADHDVLAWYDARLADAGATLEDTCERLIAVFAILIGLGIRESSGEHCRGPDWKKIEPSDDHPTGTKMTAPNAEAGLFQLSADSLHRSTDRQALFAAFRDREDLLATFRAGITCEVKDDTYGDADSDEAAFQDAMKHNPLFAVLYAAAFLRTERTHWGPINEKMAEVSSHAVDLLRDAHAAIVT